MNPLNRGEVWLADLGPLKGDREQLALCYQIWSIDRRKLIHKIGDLDLERLSDIEIAVAFVLGLPS